MKALMRNKQQQEFFEHMEPKTYVVGTPEMTDPSIFIVVKRGLREARPLRTGSGNEDWILR
jgi:hypothetical protein